MDAIRNFAFKDKLVRKVTLNGSPWFVGKDICECLDLKNYSTSLDSLDDDERGLHTMETPGGDQRVIVVSLPGVFRLIFRSRKQEAEEFKRWLAHEVLPEIMETGSYSPQTQAPVQYEPDIMHAPLSAKNDYIRMILRLYGRQAAIAMMGIIGLPEVPVLSHRLSGSANGRACLEYLLSAVPTEADDRCIADLIADARDGLVDAIEILARHGVVAERGFFWATPGKREFAALFDSTPWSGGAFRAALLRIDGITDSHPRMSIGGQQLRPLRIEHP